jgi:hypothetical protein
LLCKETVIEYHYKETNTRITSGNSDYVISGFVEQATGTRSVKAYIWELKAPQCFLFDKDTENRLIPSRELFQAENQLLNYFEDIKGSERLRARFGICHPTDIVLGGIIIGCNKTKVNGDFSNPETGMKLYVEAERIRNHYFYNPWGIKLITWDTILDQLSGKSIKPKITTGPEKARQYPIGRFI